MSSVIKPFRVTVNILSGSQVVSVQEQRVLLIGQKLPAGTATAGALIEDIANDGSQDALFGANSQIALMVDGFKAANKLSRLDVISLDDDGGATDAAGTITFVGAATETVTATYYIGSANNPITITVTSTDTDTIIGDALVAAVTANTKVPAVAVNVAGVVTFTAVNAGDVGNSMLLRAVTEIAGITSTVVGMAGGATNPSLATVFDPIVDERYQTIVYPFEYGITAIGDFLDPRFNTSNNILDGVGLLYGSDTFASLTALAGTRNSESICITAAPSVTDTLYVGGAVQLLDHVSASIIAGLRSLRLTDGANLSDIVTTAIGSTDNIGGVKLSSLPYHNTPVDLFPVIDTTRGWTQAQADSLESAGISVVGNRRDRGAVILGNMVTLYTADNSGNPDTTFTRLNSVDTSVAARELIVESTRQAFSQFRLVQGTLLDNVNMTNAAGIRQFIVGVYSNLVNFALAEGGPSAARFFNDNLIISIDLTGGKGVATVTMRLPIVGQFVEFNANAFIQFGFDVAGA